MDDEKYLREEEGGEILIRKYYIRYKAIFNNEKNKSNKPLF